MSILIKFSIIIHLGKNPKNGGSPPKDRKLIKKQNFMVGDWLLNKNIWLMLNILNLLNIQIIVTLMNK